MEQSKKDILERGGIAHQQALVELLTPTKIKTRKRVIPGGKDLLETVSREDLPNAIYTWLRGCRFFTEVTVSLCQDIAKRNTTKTKLIELSYRTLDDGRKIPAWEQPKKGKNWLAIQIADIILNNKVLAVHVDEDSISIITDNDDSFNPKSDDWEPYIEYVPRRQSRFQVY
jgi:hypothetical protein